jgi:hypothetical protein
VLSDTYKIVLFSHKFPPCIGPAVSLWRCVVGVLKHSLQLLVEVKEFYKQLKGAEEEDRKFRLKWVELSVDTLLYLSIETLRHSCSSVDHMTTDVCHVSTSPDHMTIKYECRELIYHNLFEFTSFLDCSQSIYILKDLVRLHQKLLLCSFAEGYEPFPIHSSLLKLFQSDIFVKSARSWLGRVHSPVNPMKVQCHDVVDAGVQAVDVIGHSSVGEANEQNLTLKSNLTSIVIRKEVLLLLRYLVSILTSHQKASSLTQDHTAGKVYYDVANRDNTMSYIYKIIWYTVWVCHNLSFTGYTQLEELLSSVSQLLKVSTAVDPASPSVMADAQRRLLELLSEQDGCLIEGLTLSCRITKSLKKMYDHYFFSIRLSPRHCIILLSLFCVHVHL